MGGNLDDDDETNEFNVLDTRISCLTQILRELFPEVRVTINWSKFDEEFQCYITNPEGTLLPPSLELVMIAQTALHSYAIPTMQELTLMASDCGSHDHKWLKI